MFKVVIIIISLALILSNTQTTEVQTEVISEIEDGAALIVTKTQTDFVKYVDDRTAYTQLKIRKNKLRFEVALDNGVKCVSYVFLKDKNDDFVRLYYSYITDIAEDYSDTISANGSNMEFALSVNSAWIPEHNDIETAINIDDPIYLLDGKELDPSFMKPGKWYEGSEFELKQHFYGKVSNINYLEIQTNHKIDLIGMVSVAGNINILQECCLSGYGMMMPVNGSILNKFVTGIGNYKINAADNTRHYFVGEEDRVNSFCAVGEENPDYIIAMTIDDLDRSFRIGQNGRADLNKFVFLWQREAAPKLYCMPYNNYSASAGDQFNFSGRFIIAYIDNIYNLI
jgi:hypothetical protein